MGKTSHVVLCALLLAGCSDDQKPDTSPPERIDDLDAELTMSGAIRLSWTAPGDDGHDGRATQYEIRYSSVTPTEATWGSGTIVDSPPSPQEPDRTETLQVAGLQPAIWYFGVKAADEVPNWSALSNIVSVSTIDTIPPSAIDDLAADAATLSTVTLSWTATGSDGLTGRASAYDLRYSLDAITDESWTSSTTVEDEPVPSSAGAHEVMLVTGLTPSTLYHFALRSSDLRGNLSPLSNVVRAATATPGIRRLTTSSRPVGAVAPDWSPDGDEMLFYADWDVRGRGQLYVMDTAGGAARRLTDFDEGTYEAVWSRDGTNIAFAANRLIDPQTWRELWIISSAPGATPVRIASHGDQPIFSPSWSPDGGSVAYAVRTAEEPAPRYAVYTVSVSGGDPDHFADIDGVVRGLDWSPDGETLAVSIVQAESADIWGYPVKGGAPTLIVDDPAEAIRPAWSRNGDRLSFSSNRTGDYNIYFVDYLSGATPVQVTFGENSEVAPTWSPDGTNIAFQMSDAGTNDIWLTPIE